MMIVMVVMVLAGGQWSRRALLVQTRKRIARRVRSNAKSKRQAAHSAKLVAEAILVSAGFASQRAAQRGICGRVPGSLGGEALHGLHGGLDRFLAGRWVAHVGAKASEKFVDRRIDAEIAFR
jgi:hypothetical protein